MSDARPGLLILGAGRMGRLVHDVAEEAGFEVVGVISRHRPDRTAETTWFDNFDAVTGDVSLLIDFSLPDGTRAAAEWCARNRVPLVSGTTGLQDGHKQALSAAAGSTPVLWAANFSIGVHLCLQLVAQAAAQLSQVQSLEITDVHHVHKLDAPSGTALALGAAAEPLEAAYDSIRQGEEIGHHDVRFRLAGEDVSISHTARDRGIYARGALEAGRWLMGQNPGIYTLADAFA